MSDIARLAITPIDTTLFDQWRDILNLHLHPAAGDTLYWKDECGDLYTEIGQLIWTNTDGIHIHPYVDIHPNDHQILMAAALDAAHTKPRAQDGWCRYTQNGRRGWVCTLSTTTVPNHTARAIRANEGRRERNGRLIRAASQHP